MATPKTAGFSNFTMKLGNGASPEVFTSPCGMKTRSFNRTVSTGQTEVPDCADESLPSVIMREVTALDWTVTASGVLSLDDIADWESWLASGDERNVKINAGSGTGNGGSWKGAMILTQLNYSGTKGEKAAIEVTMVGSGDAPNFVAN